MKYEIVQYASATEDTDTELWSTNGESVNIATFDAAYPAFAREASYPTVERTTGRPWRKNRYILVDGALLAWLGADGSAYILRAVAS